jgi:hypothetical protein
MKKVRTPADRYTGHDEVVFSERQQFRQLWIWLILFAFAAFLLFIIISALMDHDPGLDPPLGSLQLGLAVIGMAAVVSIFAFARLDTQVDAEGIRYRFTPFHFKTRFLPWSKISKSYVRKYNAILEYGGWGIRITGLRRKGRAFNVSGNMGLQLELDNGRKILLGTRRPDELKEVLQNLGKLSSAE